VDPVDCQLGHDLLHRQSLFCLEEQLFVGGLQFGRIPGTGQMQRIVFNERWEERREAFFVELRQRIRNVRQCPDGLLYVLTDEDDGALLILEPA
jgi:glucose/arabinose dehydrogenase